MLQTINAHPRDSNIKFDEGPHVYHINGDSSYTSVTTWCHSHFPKFDADLIIDKMMASKKWEKSKYFGQTKEEIKKLWSDNGKKASSAGTKLHNDIENFYNTEPYENESPEFQYFLDYHSKIPKEWEPFRTEWMVYDEDLKIAGSIDMIYIKPDGKLIIADWKRCKEISKTNYFESAITECISHLPSSNFWQYSLQLNTYRIILEKKYGYEIAEMFLVCLHPNKTTWKKVQVPFLKQEMDDLVALRNKLKSTKHVCHI